MSATESGAPLLLALGIGLLLGVERERTKGTGTDRRPEGVRTFALTSLLGGISYQAAGVAAATTGLALTGLIAVAGYLRRSTTRDPGLTTEVALLVAYLLGVLAQQDATLAAGLAVVTAIVLAGRDRMHHLVRDKLSDQELHDGLLFAACALIVLPLLPDHGLGPDRAFNPAAVWRLVVIVMSVQAMAYVALRTIGPRYGLMVVGLLGGFVSATVTVAVMGRRSVRRVRERRSAIAAGAAASVATVVLLAVVVGAASIEALRAVALPLALAGVAALAYAAAFAVHATRGPEPEEPERGRAFDLRVAVALAGTVALVLFAASQLDARAGRAGLIAATSVAGFADSQSPAISAASLAAGGQVGVEDAALAILAALTTNSISKAVVAGVFGKRRYAFAIIPGLALILAAAWGGLAVVA